MATGDYIEVTFGSFPHREVEIRFIGAEVDSVWRHFSESREAIDEIVKMSKRHNEAPVYVEDLAVGPTFIERLRDCGVTAFPMEPR